MDLEVGSMEVVARLQVDKIVGTVEGTVEGIAECTVEGTVEHSVEGTVDTDSLLLDYIDLDSLQNRLEWDCYCLVPQSGPQLRMVPALQKVDIHLPALGKGSTSIQLVLMDRKPVKT
jgi:hypothetical protein